jgi:hypothetical protein
VLPGFAVAVATVKMLTLFWVLTRAFREHARCRDMTRHFAFKAQVLLYNFDIVWIFVRQ